jgi:hypothetical protein
LTRSALPLWGQATYALLNIGIGVALYRRMRWAWWTLTVLSGISLLLAGLMIGLAGLPALTRLVGPGLYSGLLTRPSVRAWYRPGPPPQPETLAEA